RRASVHPVYPVVRRNSLFQLHLTQPEFHADGSDALILTLDDPLPLYEDQNLLPGPARDPGHSASVISAISR
ncbi:LOW QUALITY PROTEIN: hypothetical protein PanWU01x14_038880, partial [Parasponia andersonii]